MFYRTRFWIVVRESSHSGLIARSNTNIWCQKRFNCAAKENPAQSTPSTELEEVSCEPRPKNVEELSSERVFFWKIQALDFGHVGAKIGKFLGVFPHPPASPNRWGTTPQVLHPVQPTRSSFCPPCRHSTVLAAEDERTFRNLSTFQPALAKQGQ